jgi:hypothetical protein
MDDIECKEFLDALDMFYGMMCMFLCIFWGMCRCIKLFGHNVNQMYKSSYILNVHEDDETWVFSQFFFFVFSNYEVFIKFP